MKYLNLDKAHINKLEQQNCSAENWKNVYFKELKNLEQVRNVHFSGEVKVGILSGKNISFGNVERPNGIYNTHLHNCTIGDRPFIKNIKNYIANYTIGNDVVIENVDIIATEGKSSFGNGLIVEPMNESGGRAFPIFDGLTAQMAYILGLYRHRDKVIENLKKMISIYSEAHSSEKGTIGNNVVIANTKTIKNVVIGEYTRLYGVSCLINGSINSYKEAPVYIGDSVMAKNFIISSDATVDNATVISNCFVGQGCVLDKHYSAEHSIFLLIVKGLMEKRVLFLQVLIPLLIINQLYLLRECSLL